MIADLPNQFSPESDSSSDDSARIERRVRYLETTAKGTRDRLDAPYAFAGRLEPPLTQILEDDSILSSGDITKNDVFQVTLESPAFEITAIRLETLPHPSPSWGWTWQASY